MKAAIYVRYSTANQDATSLEGQERVCRAHADRLGHFVVNVYSDAGISGTTLARPGLQRLLADAQARKFKALIISDLSRLSRDRIDLGVLVRQLADCSVRVLDVATQTDSDDDSSDTIHAVQGIVSQEYVKAVRVATHRQLQTRALAGFNAGGKAYGFTSIEEPNPTDPKNPKRLSVIDRSEAAVVRRVFERAAAGSSPREIAQALNADGVPAPHDGGRGFKQGRGWGHTTIRSMLQSRRYIGEVTWNAYRWKKTARGTRRRIARPATEHVVKSYPELAIIDVQLWERVQARYTKRKPSAAPTTPRAVRARHALSGLLTCGVCGGTFGVVYSRKTNTGSTRYLGCVAAKDRGPAVCANRATIPLPRVVRGVATHLRERLARPDRVETFVAAFRQRWEELEAKGSPTRELEGRIERQRAAVAAVLQNMAVAPGSKALAAALAVEEAKQSDLEAQLQAARATRPKVLPHPAAIAKFVSNIAEALERDDVAAAGDLLRERLAPFQMLPQADGCYRLVGAINLGGPSDLSCSGGVI